MLGGLCDGRCYRTLRVFRSIESFACCVRGDDLLLRFSWFWVLITFVLVVKLAHLSLLLAIVSISYFIHTVVNRDKLPLLQAD